MFVLICFYELFFHGFTETSPVAYDAAPDLDVAI